MSEPIVTDEDETEYRITPKGIVAVILMKAGLTPDRVDAIATQIEKEAFALVRRRLAERLRAEIAGAYDVTVTGAGFINGVKRSIRIVESDE